MSARTFKRLVAQIHDIPADTPAQADRIARLRAQAVDTALRPLGMASAWAPTVSEADGADGQLLDILFGCYLADEVDDDPERNPHPDMVEIESTTIPERLLAWRDAAVKSALESAGTATTDADRLREVYRIAGDARAENRPEVMRDALTAILDLAAPGAGGSVTR